MLARGATISSASRALVLGYKDMSFSVVPDHRSPDGLIAESPDLTALIHTLRNSSGAGFYQVLFIAAKGRRKIAVHVNFGRDLSFHHNGSHHF